MYTYCNNNPITYTDESGEFVLSTFLIGLGINIAIGAITGAAAYTVSELVSYAITDEWSWSWAGFAGSVLGGTIGGFFASISTFPGVISAGVLGFASTAIDMCLQNAWEGTEYSFWQILLTSVANGLISTGAGALFNAIPIKGLNSGRGSYSAITKQITTKFYNGTISRISAKTFSKMLSYNLASSTCDSVTSGIMDATETNGSMVSWIRQRLGV